LYLQVVAPTIVNFPAFLPSFSLRRATCGGFSLIELLAVLTVIVLLASLVTPAAQSLLKGSALTQGGQMVGDLLSFARQSALSRSRSVEVRFYQYADPGEPGEAGAGAENGRFRAMQIFEIDDAGTAVPLGKVQLLPTAIIFDSGADLSSVLGRIAAKSGADLNVSIPRVGKAYNSVAWQYSPEGSTNLTATGNWFLTLHSQQDGDKLAASQVPANFFTLHIEPVNGHIKVYRPGI